MTHGGSALDGPRTFRYSIDEGDQPALAIVKAVSWINGVDAFYLEPLSSAVDVGKLSGLLRHARRHLDGETAQSKSMEPNVTFRYEGCLVTVTTDRLRVETL